MILAILCLSFLLSWHDTNVPPCDAFRVYRDGALIARVLGTSFEDTTALDGVRYSYKIIAVRDGLTSRWSPSRSVLALRWNQGIADTLWYSAARDSTLLFVCLPRAPWAVNWALGSSEHVVAHSDYDLDFNNALDLRDLVFFAGLPGRRTADECRAMLNVYHRQARMEWQR
jgi:hypothetical protein